MRKRERAGRFFRPTRAARWVAAAALAGLAGCINVPRAFDLLAPSRVAGLPAGAPWVALPLGSWIAESEATPHAIAACLDASCPARLAVGLFEARGEEARMLSAILDDPQRLRRALQAQDAADVGRARAVRTAIAVEPWSEGSLRGFAIRLARADNTRPAFGAVLAARSAGLIRFAIAVGAEPEAVRRTVAEVAAANLR
jgi:hypothetical protein